MEQQPHFKCYFHTALRFRYILNLIFLRRREGKRAEDREIETRISSPVCWFTSQVPVTFGAGMGQSHKPKSPTWVEYHGAASWQEGEGWCGAGAGGKMQLQKAKTGSRARTCTQMLR